MKRKNIDNGREFTSTSNFFKQVLFSLIKTKCTVNVSVFNSRPYR